MDLYQLLRPLLFRLDPELSHSFSMTALKYAEKTGALRYLLQSRGVESFYKPKTVFGIEFPNQIGLAAGFDKNAEYLPSLAALGFGFIEIGTVTPKPQAGNPKPRLFRIPAQEALINRMGFNNQGAERVAENIRRSGYKGVLGINIGKNASTLAEEAVEDYLFCLRSLGELASYLVINVSSPNTSGLRDLQKSDTLFPLVQAVLSERDSLVRRTARKLPVLVKLAPDLDDVSLSHLAAWLPTSGIDGLVATNTTTNRRLLPEAWKDVPGGLSGAPLRGRSIEVVRNLSGGMRGALPIIASGGILHGADAAAMIDAGADLCQIYTGFVYRGPKLIREAVESCDF